MRRLWFLEDEPAMKKPPAAMTRGSAET